MLTYLEKKTQIEKQNILLYDRMRRILNRPRNRSQSFRTPTSVRDSRLKSLSRI